MNVNLINIIFITIFGVSSYFFIHNDLIKKKVFIISSLIFLSLEVAYRGLSVGSDTAGYYWRFYDIAARSWNEIILMFINRYFLFNSEDDVGYFILIKIISSFTNNWQIFNLISNSIFFIPLGIFINKYSISYIHVFFALLLYCCLFHVMALTGSRQLYCLGICFISFYYWDRKKYYLSILYLFVSVFLHFSSIIFLLPLIFSFIPVNYLKKIHICSLAIIPLVLTNVNKIIRGMGQIVSIEKYSKYGESEIQTGSTTFITLIIIVSIFCYFAAKDNILIENKELRNMYVFVPLFTFFAMLIYSNGTMIRISMYFHIFIILLIPYCIDIVFAYKQRRIIYLFSMLFIILLSINGNNIKYVLFNQ